MTEVLTAQQNRQLEQAVARGQFASVEEAVQIAVADLIGTLAPDDLDWARPLVEEARASLGRGGGLPAANVKAELAAHLLKLARP